MGDNGADQGRDDLRQAELLEAQKHPVEAPSHLCIAPGRLPATVAFLAKIYELTCGLRVSTLVDLRPCRHITPEGCLLLTAELERCVRESRRQIWVHYPASHKVSSRLADFGFFSHLQMTTPVQFRVGGGRRKQRKDFILVRSGTGADVVAKLNDIAGVTNALYDDPNYADAVDIALQEAMTNVKSHAFDGPEPSREAALPGRWWFAGWVDRESREAVFYALDHGVGIPTRAPSTMGDVIATYWSRQPVRPDRLLAKHILEGAVSARRKEGIETRNNNGLPAMIGLVETDSVGGSIQIRSGKAGYEFSKTAAQNGHPVTSEKCYGFRRPFPGTLVVWRVAGPAKAQLEAK